MSNPACSIFRPFILTLLATVPLAARASWFGLCTEAAGKPVTEARNLPAFSRIEMRGQGELHLTQSVSPAPFKIEAAPNLLKLFKTRVENGTLIIENKECIMSQVPVKMHLQFSRLEKLDLSGAATVYGVGKLTADKLALDTSGAGEIHLDLAVNELSTDASGASELYLKGSAVSYTLEMSGAGDLLAPNLVVGSYAINISGAGDCDIHATEKLKVEISGAGAIRYRGKPAITSNISGAGSVTAAGI